MHRVVPLAGAAAVLVGMLVLALGRDHHQLGSNYVPPGRFVVMLGPGAVACQRDERVPPETGLVRLYAGTYARPGGAVRVRLTSAGTTVTGTRAPGWDEPRLDVPLRPAAGRDAVLCVRNAGSERIALAGRDAAPSVAARVGGRPAAGRLRVEYRAAERRSWLAFAPELSDRVATVRSAAPGRLSLPLWGILSLLVVFGVAGVLVRLVRR